MKGKWNPVCKSGHFHGARLLEARAWAGLAVSHGLREGAQRSRGHAKVTQRVGSGVGRSAGASAQRLATAQASGVLGTVPGLPRWGSGCLCQLP